MSDESRDDDIGVGFEAENLDDLHNGDIVSNEKEDMSTDTSMDVQAANPVAAKKKAAVPVAAKKKAAPKPKPADPKTAPKAAARKQTPMALRPRADRPQTTEGLQARMRPVAFLLKMVSDPTRVAVLNLLADGPRNVGDICRSLGGLSQPAVSHHLSLLRHGRLISPQRSGKNNIYELEEAGAQLAGLIRTITPAR